MTITRRTIDLSASGERLEKLIRERAAAPDSEKEKIDQRIWDLFGEDWAVMFTDLSGFSRGVEKFGIIHFLQTIFESERILLPVVYEHDGVLLKIEGDSLLVIFKNVNKAVKCAIEMQRTVRKYNANRPGEEEILLCVGIGYGKVLKIGDSDVFGAEVNAASKLGEDQAKAYEIMITGSVHDVLADRAGLTFEPLSKLPPGTKTAYRVKY